MQWKVVVLIILDLVMTKTSKDISVLYVYSMVHFTFLHRSYGTHTAQDFCVDSNKTLWFLRRKYNIDLSLNLTAISNEVSARRIMINYIQKENCVMVM